MREPSIDRGHAGGEVPRAPITPELIQAARDGSTSAQEAIFQWCRPFLERIAEQEFPDDLKAKAGSSDLVQQSCLEAHENFARFQGETEEQLKHWLRRILLHNQVNFIRLFRTEMRDVGREEQLLQSTEGHEPAVSSSSPSAEAAQKEGLERLRQAIEDLPGDYREAVKQRQQEGLTFEEIGQRMNRSAEAVRKLWARAIDMLREALNKP